LAPKGDDWKEAAPAAEVFGKRRLMGGSTGQRGETVNEEDHNGRKGDSPGRLFFGPSFGGEKNSLSSIGVASYCIEVLVGGRTAEQKRTRNADSNELGNNALSVGAKTQSPSGRAQSHGSLCYPKK